MENVPAAKNNHLPTLTCRRVPASLTTLLAQNRAPKQMHTDTHRMTRVTHSVLYWRTVRPSLETGGEQNINVL
jgi:hypothetical protein